MLMLLQWSAVRWPLTTDLLPSFFFLPSAAEVRRSLTFSHLPFSYGLVVEIKGWVHEFLGGVQWARVLVSG